VERSIRHVPRSVLGALAVALAIQLGSKALLVPAASGAEDLAPAPGMSMLRLAGFGDPIPLARLLMLYLQAFDYQSGTRVPYQALDYERLQAWLARILELDPAGQYPLHAASRLYAEVPDNEKRRKMLDFIYKEFQKDPGRRWPWLAHAAVVAKQQLKDLPLARKYAAAIQEHAKGEDVPLWARQMQAFILEDMNELETAKIMIGGFIQSGMVKDPGELRFLEGRLKEIEARIGAGK